MYQNLTEFKSAIPNQGRIVALDVGSKTIGIALSCTTQTIATPSHLIKRKKFTNDANLILDFVLEQNAIAIVIGLPVTLDGEDSKTTQSTKQFARNLSKLTDLPIYLQDERMSSIISDNVMKQAGMATGKRQENIDKISAGYILQTTLDSLSNL